MDNTLSVSVERQLFFYTFNLYDLYHFLESSTIDYLFVLVLPKG